MTGSLLSTKLYVPPTRLNGVPRPHLIEQMDKGLGCKLTLVSAPAGFGKSTLVSEWLAGCQRPVAWLSLDEGDNDPTRFLAYLVAAVQTVAADVGAGVLAALQSPQPPSTESLLTSLLNDIAAAPGSFILVLDDYHVIDSQPVDEALVFLVEHLPPQMHLVIATREDPHLPLARLRARGQLSELRAADLRFTPAEAVDFLNRVMGLGLSAEDICALEARTEGWIAGLQLAAISMQGHKDASGFIKSFTGSHRFVLDYLLEEVLQQQPESIQTFLLVTSILDRMCGSLCDAVLCDPSVPGQQTLERIEQANLFIVPLDSERRWNRYHHLFRELLQARLLKAHPGQAAELHRRASDWFASQNSPEDAIAHALAARDYQRVAGLVEQAAQQLDMQNSLVAITRWIDAIPDEMVAVHPWLCIYRAWGYYWVGRRDSVETWLKAAEDRLPIALEAGKADASHGHLLGHIAAIRAHAALTGEDITRVLAEGQRALDLLPERDEMRCETAVAMGGAYWALGRVIDSEQAFAVARAAALKCSHLTMAVPSTCYVGMQQVKQGRLAAAEHTYQDGLRLAVGQDGQETPVAGFPNIKLGDLYREWNDLERAEKLLHRGVEQCTLLGQADVLVDGYVSLARFQMGAGNLVGMSESLQLADHIVAKTKVDPFVLCWLEDSRLRLWAGERDYSSIAHWTEACGLSVAGPFSYHYDLHHANLARALAVMGAYTHSQPVLLQATDLLGRLYEAANSAGWVREKIQILALHALAESAMGRDDAALAAISQALALAEPGGFIRLFLDEGAPMARLLSQARARGVMPDYVSRLLAAFASEPLSGHDTAEVSNDLLTQRELEVLQLVAQGLSNQEIGERLFLALDTVKGHNRRIYGKLQVQSRTEAIARARELGLL